MGHNHYPDPKTRNPRINAAFKALTQRAREPTQVMIPATKEVVVSAKARLTRDTASPGGTLNKTVAESLDTGWLYLPERPSAATSAVGHTTYACVWETSYSTT